MGVNSGKGSTDTCWTPRQHLTVQGSVIFHFFKTSAGSGTVMTSRPCANTQKYLEGCNFFAISVPKNSLLKYDFQFCVSFFISL